MSSGCRIAASPKLLSMRNCQRAHDHKDVKRNATRIISRNHLSSRVSHLIDSKLLPWTEQPGGTRLRLVVRILRLREQDCVKRSEGNRRHDSRTPGRRIPTVPLFTAAIVTVHVPPGLASLATRGPVNNVKTGFEDERRRRHLTRWTALSK